MSPAQVAGLLLRLTCQEPVEKARGESVPSTDTIINIQIAGGGKVRRHSLDRMGYLAGAEADRASDLIDALTDPTISAVFCIRGGYGSNRLLPHLPFASLRKHPKIFLGYSDITFLHLAFWRTMGWVTFHGPNLVEWEEEAFERGSQVLARLQGGGGFAWRFEQPQVLRCGLAAGVLVGGNLTCLTHLLMTPFCPNFDGVLLMIEDRGEALYRIDRQITQLRLAGLFDRIHGLILGHFHECGPVEEIWSIPIAFDCVAS